ncbi:MAG: protein-L-isoaspartate(D-aspartate) O-methyltransferase [Gammaproteobacteria bacterium]|nr:protein-L-isoaspartate(D-aspartate) O-methyltransferase [Gammaproteobacteria bacterium]NNF60593.1 protein-L-isoaspartate(D-aspartate) O-methyltransferase [Gammaproteobacteria bacterium]NNM21377.1 protein-L-isoaspartate(D-aspartate) O-methyltransferase [Gammaproteobacteria bacterium]
MRRHTLTAIAALLAACSGPDPVADHSRLQQQPAQHDTAPAHRLMLEEIRRSGPPYVSERVMTVMEKVARHEFVTPRQRRVAYDNRPLPIGAGQTISQPYIVALMTDLAGVDAESVVLEVGTGSGYQAAVLAELAGHVYTIEIIDMLAERAAATLDRLGYDNVSVRAGDGYAGWPENAPFDAILVTAAPETVPQPLIDQLAVGGRLVIPVGPEGRTQILQVLTKLEDGSINTNNVAPVIFVPFTRD